MENWTIGTFLLLYGIISFAIFLGFTLFLCMGDTEEEEISFVEVGSYSIFWLFYLIFYLPKIIFVSVKFLYNVCKTFVCDIFEFYKK